MLLNGLLMCMLFWYMDRFCGVLSSGEVVKLWKFMLGWNGLFWVLLMFILVMFCVMKFVMVRLCWFFRVLFLIVCMLVGIFLIGKLMLGRGVVLMILMVDRSSNGFLVEKLVDVWYKDVMVVVMMVMCK